MPGSSRRRPEPLPDKLYAVIDGTGVPMTSAETYGRSGKGDDGRARTREVKLAVFFTQDKLDKDGCPVRGEDTDSHIATFEPAARSPAWSRPRASAAARPRPQLTIIGDGAAWIWNIASAQFPEATQIVDLYHAREHLNDLAKLMEFMPATRKRNGWPRGWKTSTTATSTASPPPPRLPLVGIKKNQLDTALGYFENNAPRMRCHWLRQCGLFVGSGVVEASCKSVMGQRLKLSGMHWSLTGADAITTLRCQQASAPKTASGPQPATRRSPHDQPSR